MTILAPPRPAPAADPAVPATESDDCLRHVYCCDPETALCGTDLSDTDETDDDDAPTCVVCLDLEDVTCPRCGE